MIHVIATITVKPGERDAFLAAFKANVPAVLAEEGCLAYEPTVDVPSPHPAAGPVRANVVTVVERWGSVAQLMAHSKAPHMAAFFEQHGHRVESVTLTVTEPR